MAELCFGGREPTPVALLSRERREPTPVVAVGTALYCKQCPEVAAFELLRRKVLNCALSVVRRYTYCRELRTDCVSHGGLPVRPNFRFRNCATSLSLYRWQVLTGTVNRWVAEATVVTSPMRDSSPQFINSLGCSLSRRTRSMRCSQ